MPSGEIEYVDMGRSGSEYETHFSCSGCGKTVEGDEDPPDGWCYKGMHTTDVKRARFRAASTSDGDMLEPCDKLDCHIIHSPPPRPWRARQAAPLPPVDLADSDDDNNNNASRYTEDSPVVVEIVRTVGAVGQNTMGQHRTKATAGTLTQAHVRIDSLSTPPSILLTRNHECSALA
ncbi:hypothetical protein EDB85DRAFT_2212471 [Lactarius pseudohatsudake]|nr:hypothetical protein EDB85DRAFT_2212471 [Lactarius pseudohatsudake]